MTLRRHNSGQLGFNVHNEGMVVDVEPNGLAQVAGLRQSSRLVEVCVEIPTLLGCNVFDVVTFSVRNLSQRQTTSVNTSLF